MEVNNVKLDWSAILENEISYYEKVLDSSNIREMYSGIIAMLDQNNLKSRVIISNNVVVAYAFLIRPNDFSDRIYAHIGFVNDIAANTTRLDTLITWARNEARYSGLLLLFNAPFNGGTCFTGYVNEKGIESVERVEMTGSTRVSGIISKLPDSIKIISLEKADIEQMDGSLIEAFREEREYILIACTVNIALKYFLIQFTFQASETGEYRITVGSRLQDLLQFFSLFFCIFLF